MAARKRVQRRRASEMTFDPMSFNAQFASLHAKLKSQTEHFNGRLDQQDEKLDRIELQGTTTKKDVDGLKHWRTGVKAWIACAAFIGSALVTLAYKLLF